MPNSESRCWLICISEDNFRVDRQNNFSVEGFRARNRRLVSEVKPGDKFVVYINQLQRFGATLQATGKPYIEEYLDEDCPMLRQALQFLNPRISPVKE